MLSTPPVRPIETIDTPGPEDFLIRPATSSDIGDFYELACLAGAGFTSLPADEAILSERLLASEVAFAGGSGSFMLALEDRQRRRVVGCAAIKPGGTPLPDFLNFQVDAGKLIPTTRYAGVTEVGSLLLHPDYRRHGIGPWLARSRYLLIAAAPGRFGDSVFSELRGMVDECDRSPFYDAVCAGYFGCSFAEADGLCAEGRQAELNARLPKAPIPLSSLPPDARDAIAKPHQAGRRALDYLTDEGFVFEGVVDLLDGGPAVVADTRSIRTIRQAFQAPIGAGTIDTLEATDSYIAIGAGSDYRCCRSPVTLESGAVVCPPDIMQHLEAKRGTIAHICPLEERSRSSAASQATRSRQTADLATAAD